jgi:sialate O-acetylesterase
MKLAALFCDHAVLQRDRMVPLWGCTRARVFVRASIGASVGESFSDDRGDFLIRLPPQPAGGPYTLTVETCDGRERVEVADVMIGEVWLCSGQSNMQWAMKDLQLAVAPADIPGVRQFTVCTIASAVRARDVQGDWQAAVGASCAHFSAVAYYFASRLHRELGVAVGVVNASWGGTRIEAWTSRSTLVQRPETAEEVRNFERTAYRPEAWQRLHAVDLLDNQQMQQVMDRCYPVDPGNQGFARGWAEEQFDDAGWAGMRLPSTWQARGYQHTGIFWFRRTVEVPAAWAGQDLELHTGALDKTDITYFNGVQVGATGTGFDQGFWNVARCYTIPGHLVRAGRNVIAVRVYSFVNHGGMIGPADKMCLQRAGEDSALPLAGEWRACCEQRFESVAVGVFGPGNQNSPYTLFDSMIAPLQPFAIRGAAWYQGESNAERPATYGAQLRAMIQDWRHAWGQGDFPFLIVQLANFMAPSEYQADSSWALVREGQLRSLEEPETGLAVAIELGEEADIHPRNKLDVGNRLAQWALARVYGQAIPPSGPLYDGLSVEPGRIRIRFRHTDGGLVVRGGLLKTFVVAGADRVFHAAEARVEGDMVVVQSAAVPHPVAVRYAWADNPLGCNLYNAAGLPASPFRTDAW